MSPGALEAWAVIGVMSIVVLAIVTAVWAIGCFHRRETRLQHIEYELKYRTDFEKKARGEARLHPDATILGFVHSYDIGRGSK